jgi:FkbM family methyltransferase
MMNLRYVLRSRKFRTKWDPAEIAWIVENVGKGGVCFDIGAHKGGWTYWLRKAVGRGGKVFAFEPQPTLFQYLSKLLSSRYWSNVKLENIALSDREGTMKMFIPGQPGSTSPGASLKEDVLAHESDTHDAQVSAMTLDQYVAAQSIESIDFIKVDVEGSELDVLKGSESTLKNHDASWIIESESRHIEEEGVLELFSRMEEAGYEGYFFSPEGLQPVSEFSFAKYQNQEAPRFWDDLSYCNNFLFTRARR